MQMNFHSDRILIVQMGGTIDKTYPRYRYGYAFEIGSPASCRILSRVKPSLALPVHHITVCQKDSLEVEDTDREQRLRVVLNSGQERVVVTHGTDTLLETAHWLQAQLKHSDRRRLVVMVGAFAPERFRDSDADFNLGLALGAVQAADFPEGPKQSHVLVAMNGIVCHCDEMERNSDTGQFQPRSIDCSL